jgi:polyhydroxybutyrate depolymerase
MGVRLLRSTAIVLCVAAAVACAASGNRPQPSASDAQPPAQKSVVQSAQARAAAAELPPNATLKRLTAGGIGREYWVVRPPLSDGPSAVVFVLHGGAVADGSQTFRYGFQTLGARDGVVTVHPSGVGAGWNDGRNTPYLLARGGAPDDVAFFRGMIDALIAEGVADPRRIYITGGSNGGMMTQRLVCELSDKIAAAAPFVALLPSTLEAPCRPSHPTPMLFILGTADRLMPFDGGAVAPMSGDDRGAVLGFDQSFAFWADRNRCGSQVNREALADADPTDGTRVYVQRAQGCARPLLAYIVEGGGHRLPGEMPRIYSDPRLARLSGISSADIDGKSVIWTFLLSQSLQ